jgi:cytidylate kinase
MKDRALRRHQATKAKNRVEKTYNSCIEELSSADREDMEGKVEKLKKVCASPYSEEHDRSLGHKTLQERKHDITMREQTR